jgi:hypothetical protein
VLIFLLVVFISYVKRASRRAWTSGRGGGFYPWFGGFRGGGGGGGGGGFGGGSFGGGSFGGGGASGHW